MLCSVSFEQQIRHTLRHIVLVDQVLDVEHRISQTRLHRRTDMRNQLHPDELHTLASVLTELRQHLLRIRRVDAELLATDAVGCFGDVAAVVTVTVGLHRRRRPTSVVVLDTNTEVMDVAATDGLISCEVLVQVRIRDVELDGPIVPIRLTFEHGVRHHLTASLNDVRRRHAVEGPRCEHLHSVDVSYSLQDVDVVSTLGEMMVPDTLEQIRIIHLGEVLRRCSNEGRQIVASIFIDHELMDVARLVVGDTHLIPMELDCSHRNELVLAMIFIQAVKDFLCDLYCWLHSVFERLLF